MKRRVRLPVPTTPHVAWAIALTKVDTSKPDIEAFNGKRFGPAGWLIPIQSREMASSKSPTFLLGCIW